MSIVNFNQLWHYYASIFHFLYMQSFGEITTGTLELLAHLESVYTLVAAYWDTEAEAFESECKQPKEASETVPKAKSLESEDKEPTESSEAVAEKCKQPKGSSEANMEA